MLLAVDTSTQWIGLALYDGADVLGEVVWQSRSHHTTELAPAIADLLQRCGVRAEDLKAAAVALGPGSFTALRIGLAVVKGMALAQRMPVVGVPTLDILAAAQAVRELPMVCILQAGRGRLAAGWYHVVRGQWQSKGDVVVTNAEALAEQIEKPTLVCGELTAAERQVLGRKKKTALLISPANSLRRPGYLAELGWKRWQAGKLDDVVSLAPIYLHVAEEIPA